MGRILRVRGWRSSPDEQFRRELSLARVRVLLALPLFVAGAFIALTTAPLLLQRIALGGYAAFALALLAAVRFKKGPTSPVALAGHVVDVCIGAGMIHVGNGPSAFPVIVFALLAAAHRWGLRATMATAVASTALLIAPPVALALLHAPSALPFAGATFSTAFAQCGLVLLTGAAVGYIAESGEQLRSETEIVAAVMNHAEVRLGLKHTLAVVFDAIVRRFDARRAIVVVNEFSTDRVFLWRGGMLSGAAAEPLTVSRLDPQNLDTFLFNPTSPAWSVVCRGGSSTRLDVVALDASGALTDDGPRTLPERFLSLVGPFEHLMGIAIERQGDWSGRLFLIDPHVGRDRARALALGERIVRHISPALDNVYLLHRLRSRSAANERARIARELHDGIIQSVMGVQIQLQALSMRGATRWEALTSELNRLATLLRDEVLNLRDMMQQLKPLDLPPDRLIDTLAEVVQRFQYETGITARFITQYDRIDLPPRACREVTRVVQEALVNIRKHSGARHVFVRLTLADGVCRLSIDDDGRGFPFTGRLSQADLERARQGPRVIKERVRLLGGHMAVESAPNQGARLDISIPLASTYAFSG